MVQTFKTKSQTSAVNVQNKFPTASSISMLRLCPVSLLSSRNIFSDFLKIIATSLQSFFPKFMPYISCLNSLLWPVCPVKSIIEAYLFLDFEETPSKVSLLRLMLPIDSSYISFIMWRNSLFHQECFLNKKIMLNY